MADGEGGWSERDLYDGAQSPEGDAKSSETGHVGPSDIDAEMNKAAGEANMTKVKRRRRSSKHPANGEHGRRGSHMRGSSRHGSSSAMERGAEFEDASCNMKIGMDSLNDDEPLSHSKAETSISEEAGEDWREGGGLLNQTGTRAHACFAAAPNDDAMAMAVGTEEEDVQDGATNGHHPNSAQAGAEPLKVAANRGSTRRSPRIKLSPKDAGVLTSADPGGEEPFSIECINLPIIVIYFVAKWEAGQGETLRMLKWLLAAVALVIFDVFVLAALSTTNNWVSCNSQDDCALGTVCVHLPSSEFPLGRAPKCFDCYYLVDEGMHGGNPAGPWSHFLVGEPGVNASAICEDVRTAPENLRYFNSMDERYAYSTPWDQLGSGVNDTRTFDNCLYAREKYELMSDLDVVILAVIFVLLAMEAAKDAREQCEARYLAELSVPWPTPSKSCRYIASFAGKSVLKFLDIMFAIGIPAMVPGALLMLLTVQGCNSTDIILNGLSVGFVLELDNHVADTFLDNKTREAIEAFFKNVGASRQDDEKAKAIVRRPFEVQVRFVVMMIAFIAGILRAGLPGSKIKCEMNFYFMYYRVGLLYTLWFSWLARELVELVYQAKSIRGSGTSRWTVVANASALLGRYVEAFLGAVALNALVFFTTTVLQFGTAPAYAFEKYFWGFISDVMGLCAASGYKDAWGYECISYF